MKKAFDQTVRDLKREVNTKVLKVPGIEQKILDATSNESWGPHGSLLADIAQASLNYHEYQMVMHVIWKRLNDTGKNWRHVYKALTVLEYLVGHGSERVIDDIREHAYQISTLSDFQYIDSSGKDQGSNVRRKSQSLVALVNDKDKIQEVRQKAIANRDKYRSTHAPSGRTSYSGGSGRGDRHDDDRYDGRYRDSYEGRYRDEDHNGYGREREWSARDDERYGRCSDPYSRDGDRYGRDSDERYGRDSYRDDDHRGGRSNDDSQFGARSRSLDRDRDRFSEEDDRNSSRHSGGRVDEPSQDQRRLEHKLSEQSPPPSYEEAVKDAHGHVQNGRGVANVAPSATKLNSQPAAKTSSPASTSQDPNQSAAGVSDSATHKEANEFDEFDPRGSMPAAPAPGSGGVDLFGNQSAPDPINSLALVPVSYGATYETDAPSTSGVEAANFVPLSSASTAFSQPGEDPFGDGTFRAITHENLQAQQQRFAPATSFQPSSGIVQGAETLTSAAPSFDFGYPLGGLTYTPTDPNAYQQFAGNPPSMGSEFPMAQAYNPSSGPSALVPPRQPQQHAFPSNMHPSTMNPVPQPSGLIPPQQTQQYMHTANMNYPPQSAMSAQPVSASNSQNIHVNHLTQPGISSQTSRQMSLDAPGKDKFETKSTVWADTLNRGLVNLNISGAKVNPLADIGVDFEAINRMDKRKEKSSAAAPVTSTITMGKAMGSGSGIGRAGAGAFAPPSNPMMGMGRGMGMAGGGSMGMGGYGGGMNQPMGMGMGMNMPMGMNQGAQMRPPAPGIGYNPMPGTGTGGFSTQQQQYGGGYR